MLSYEQALAQLLAAARPVAETRHVPITAAAGRVLAQAQVSTVNVPPLDNSAMDGYAVRLADVAQVGVTLPVSQRIPAGTVGSALQAGTAARIFTGAQAIQLRQRFAGQNVVSAGRIRAYDANGLNGITIIDFTTNVPNAQGGDTILVCTSGFVSKTAPATVADFIIRHCELKV